MNLRPLGYEPSELPNCSTPRRLRQVTGLRTAGANRRGGRRPQRLEATAIETQNGAGADELSAPAPPEPCAGQPVAVAVADDVGDPDVLGDWLVVGAGVVALGLLSAASADSARWMASLSLACAWP